MRGSRSARDQLVDVNLQLRDLSITVTITINGQFRPKVSWNFRQELAEAALIITQSIIISASYYFLTSALHDKNGDKQLDRRSITTVTDGYNVNERLFHPIQLEAVMAPTWWLNPNEGIDCAHAIIWSLHMQGDKYKYRMAVRSHCAQCRLETAGNEYILCNIAE